MFQLQMQRYFASRFVYAAIHGCPVAQAIVNYGPNFNWNAFNDDD